MSKTPQDFFNLYNLKDPDRSQCVGGFKIFMRWMGIGDTGSVGSAKNYAWGSWPQRLSGKGFIYFKDINQIRTGDWFISDAQQWPGFYNEHGHVAMYYGGKSFGKNQGRLRFEANINFSSYAPKFLCAYRPKEWADRNFTGSPITNSNFSVTGSESSSPISTVQISVDHTKLSPYIVTIDRNSPDRVNWSRLKDKKVVGVLVEGGCFVSGNFTTDFRNPKIDRQVTEVSTKANLPWGLYITARARSVEDAKKEMYEFSFLVRKYPPGLGAWIKLDLKSDKKKNDEIVKWYQKELEWLGLKYKIGFIATESQIQKQITWSDFQDDWYLWVDKHVENLTELDKLLDPTFFDIP